MLPSDNKKFKEKKKRKKEKRKRNKKSTKKIANPLREIHRDAIEVLQERDRERDEYNEENCP